MINLFNAQIESLAVHKIGNKSRNEGLFLSKELFSLNDEIRPLLKEFFLKPFREKEEVYFQFTHDVDVEFNEMYNLSKELFASPEATQQVSEKITRHLFDQSMHPHIKGGEVYVAHITNVSIDNNVVDAIGIFKSEIKSDFLEIHEKGSELEMNLKAGINLDKLDKGCLIFNYRGEEGYKILTVDGNKYDARYWLEHFLDLDLFQDEHFYTKKYLGFCQDFAKNVVLPAEDKKEEIIFLNKTANYFAKNDQFVENDYLKEVTDNESLVHEFKAFKVDRGEKYSIEDVSEFDISNSAVTEARKKFKGVINLDTNMQIKLNFINPESADKFVEKGFDEERQMYYYLLYFNNEVK